MYGNAWWAPRWGRLGIPKNGRIILGFLYSYRASNQRSSGGEMKRKETPASTEQPLDRAFALLSTLASSARPMTVTELAAACGMPVPSAHRMAAQLQVRNLVKRQLGSKKLMVGPRL